ncbi:hydrogenase maturation protease [Geomesophilobacter sediminis]|uniref:Hydrogenase maturation protease n=1 Tax=Geomesophilobacter sediminis TaxID=2798584 RepID=A0A8J7IVG3_9BACT|nr:hydrogenase maturation protease [Geomesophilobacter sediminis]MBJ6723107.1 hydrogenase maturation protease [Geomesophilobacter sediminis]
MPVADEFLTRMSLASPRELNLGGRVLRRGSRVRLNPKPGGDLLDRTLAGRFAVIEGIDEDEAGIAHVAVVLEDDPGRDMGELRHPAHRFFFTTAEIEPIEAPAAARRVLVAGIGNVFFGDDGFGVAVARRLIGRSIAPGVKIGDYGIRGMDLAYALEGYDAAIIVDAVPQGKPPGSVHLIVPDPEDGEEVPLDSHQMNPLAVLGLARRLGKLPKDLVIVGCEPDVYPAPEGPMSMGLSPPVAAAVDGVAEIVSELAVRLSAGAGTPGG